MADPYMEPVGGALVVGSSLDERLLAMESGGALAMFLAAAPTGVTAKNIAKAPPLSIASSRSSSEDPTTRAPPTGSI